MSWGPHAAASSTAPTPRGERTRPARSRPAPAEPVRRLTTTPAHPRGAVFRVPGFARWWRTPGRLTPIECANVVQRDERSNHAGPVAVRTGPRFIRRPHGEALAPAERIVWNRDSRAELRRHALSLGQGLLVDVPVHHGRCLASLT